MLRVVISVLLVVSVESGSVWWGWYPSFRECINNDNQLHQEWTRDLECIATKDLRSSDPLQQQSVNSYGIAYDVKIHCFDDSGSTNFNADDDHVEIQYYNSTSGSCDAALNGSFILNNTICGENDPSAPHALTHSRFHCSRCNFMFFDEVAPPYFIQGVGILVFLLVCILINYTLQDKFDRFMKTFPAKFGKVKIPHPVIGQLAIFKNIDEHYSPKGNFTSGESSSSSLVTSPLEPVSPIMVSPGVGRGRNYFNDDSFSDNLWAKTYSTSRSAGRGISSVSGFDDGSILTRSSSNPTGMKVRSNTHKSIIGFEQIPLYKDDSLEMNSVPVTAQIDEELSPTTNILGPPAGKRRRSATQRTVRPILNKKSKNGGQQAEVRFDYPEHSRTVDEVCSLSLECDEWISSGNIFYRFWKGYVARILSAMESKEDHKQKLYLYEGAFPNSPLMDHSTDSLTTSSTLPNDDVIDDYHQHGNVDQELIQCYICKQQNCTGKSDIRTTVLKGGLGGYFEVEKANKGYAFCSFTYPTAWVREHVFEYPPQKDVTDVPIERQEVSPVVTIIDPIGENAWRHLLSDPKEYRITESSTQSGEKLHAVRLKGVIAEWIPLNDLRIIGPCGGSYVRTAPVKEFKEGSGLYWKKWWSDFELCVGLLRRVEKDENGSYKASVKFQGSATLIVPIEVLTRVSEQDHNADFLVVPQRVTHRTMMAVFVASAPPLLAAKGCFLLVYFLYSVKNALSDGHGGRASHHSAWEAYEEVYFKLFNSGYPTLMADCGSVATYFTYVFRPTRKQFITGVGVPVLSMLALSLGISLPGIMTHALPMIGLYCVMWIPILLFLGAAMYYVRKLEPPPPPVKPDQLYDMPYIKKNFKCYLFTSGLFHLFFRFVAELIAVVFVQTNYNFAVLIYDGNPIIRTISDEFKMRQVSCAWEQGLKMASYFI